MFNKRNRPYTREKKYPEKDRRCAWCGSFFSSHNPNKRFCSDKCRIYSFLKQQRIDKQVEKEP